MPDMSLPVVNPARHRAPHWFESPHGQALLESEQAQVDAARSERPAQAWLWLAPLAAMADGPTMPPRCPGWAG